MININNGIHFILKPRTTMPQNRVETIKLIIRITSCRLLEARDIIDNRHHIVLPIINVLTADIIEMFRAVGYKMVPAPKGDFQNIPAYAYNPRD